MKAFNLDLWRCNFFCVSSVQFNLALATRPYGCPPTAAYRCVCPPLAFDRSRVRLFAPLCAFVCPSARVVSHYNSVPISGGCEPKAHLSPFLALACCASGLPCRTAPAWACAVQSPKKGNQKIRPVLLASTTWSLKVTCKLRGIQ